MNNTKNARIMVRGLVKYFYYFKKDFRIFKWIATGKGFTKEFQVLNGLHFQVDDGEIVGILGVNGAGKSTLLKLIAGVYTPTAGSVKIDGKISSLLELGAGFNPVLTGRENIYFKAGILGMTTEEIDAKIDDIIAFADIGEYMDMPLMSYSSGMGARLGFALAVNVDPDILIIDEVFAVGDREFQQKSKQKTMEFFEMGKTILFVSHSEDLIRTFCTRVVYLNDGFIEFDGEVEEGIQYYHDSLRKKSKTSAMILKEATFNDSVVCLDFEIGRSYQNSIFDKINLEKLKMGIFRYDTEENRIHDENFAKFKLEKLDDRNIRIMINASEIIHQGNITFKFNHPGGNKYGFSYHFGSEDLIFDNNMRLRIMKKSGRLVFDVSKNY